MPRAEASRARLSAETPDRQPSAPAPSVFVVSAFAFPALEILASAASALAAAVLAAPHFSAPSASLRAEAASSRRRAGRVGAAGFRSAASRLKRAAPSLPRPAGEAGRRVCLKNTSARSVRETKMPSSSCRAEAAGGQSKPRATGDIPQVPEIVPENLIVREAPRLGPAGSAVRPAGFAGCGGRAMRAVGPLSAAPSLESRDRDRYRHRTCVRAPQARARPKAPPTAGIRP